MGGPVPEWLVTATVAVTLFAVMFSVGIGISPGELRWVWRRPGPMLRGLFAVLVAVPVVTLGLVRLFDLPRFVEVGIVLMSISPGAPVALLVATQNSAPPAVVATILAYLMVSVFTIGPYIALRRRVGQRAAQISRP